jgi:hypothetical protein
MKQCDQSESLTDRLFISALCGFVFGVCALPGLGVGAFLVGVVGGVLNAVGVL